MGLPNPAQMVAIIGEWFNTYGFWFLAAAAFIEGIFVIGMYVPGSLAIVLAVYTFGDSIYDLISIGVISFLSFVVANIFNYLLGKYGYYKFLLVIGQKDSIEKMKAAMKKHGNNIFLLTGFFPNFFAITSVCAGIANVSFWNFIRLAVIALFFWITVWTTVGSFIVNRIDLKNENQSFYLIAIVFLWGVFLVVKKTWYRKKD